MIVSNVVKGDKLKEIQGEVLQFSEDTLIPSYGPNGSNTIISNENQLTRYTKDGKTIYDNVKVYGDIETKTLDDIREITRKITSSEGVGDGTTTAIILANRIFKYLRDECQSENKAPYDIIRDIKEAVENISKRIRSTGRELTLDDVYHIAYISTNGDVKFSNKIKELYEKHGLHAYVSVEASSTDKTYIREYNGMTLDTGYMDPSFVNAANAKFIADKPRIYGFIDPVNTPEQVRLFDQIISDNIFLPLQERKQPIPTVIICRSITKDVSQYLSDIITKLSSIKDIYAKWPICIVTNIYQYDKFDDIMRLTGAKPIKKYMDPKQLKIQQEQGHAPTLETVAKNFFGSCDRVEIDNYKTSIINPYMMYDYEKGEYSTTYKNLINTLETQLQTAIDEDEGINTIGNLKRRIQSLKSNLVEYYIGGITVADRNYYKDLAEDAVLNIRSAAKYGVGLASGLEGYFASRSLFESEASSYISYVYNVIMNAYRDAIRILYGTCGVTDEETDHFLDELYQLYTEGRKVGYDLRTNEYSKTLYSSIESDPVILDAISKIMTILYTSNQYLCSEVAYNNYK